MHRRSFFARIVAAVAVGPFAHLAKPSHPSLHVIGTIIGTYSGTYSGTGNQVFDVPTWLSRVRIIGTYPAAEPTMGACPHRDDSQTQ